MFMIIGESTQWAIEVITTQKNGEVSTEIISEQGVQYDYARRKLKRLAKDFSRKHGCNVYDDGRPRCYAWVSAITEEGFWPKVNWLVIPVR